MKLEGTLTLMTPWRWHQLWPGLIFSELKPPHKTFNLRTVLDLQNYCQDSTESFYMPQTQFLILLTSYVSMVHLSQFMNQHCYAVIKGEVRTSPRCPVSLECPFSVLEFHPGHHIALSYLISLGPSRLWHFRRFWLWMTLVSICKMSFNWALTIFLWSYQDTVLWEDGYTGKVAFFSSSTKGRCYQHDLSGWL